MTSNNEEVKNEYLENFVTSDGDDILVHNAMMVVFEL